MGTSAYLRLIGQLKLKLLQRHFSKNKANFFALAFFLLGMLLFSAFGGLVLFMLCREQGPAFRDTAFLWSAWVLTLLWFSAPMMQVDLTRSLDLNGLRLFPVSQLRLTLAVLLDSVISPQGILVLPALLALAACFTLSIADLPYVVLSLLLLLACILSLGQALTLWANRLLASRRFADISLIASFVVLVGIQLVNMVLQTSGSLEMPGWLALIIKNTREFGGPLAAWLFPGLSARAAAAASAGRIAEAGALYGMLAAQLGICLLCAGAATRQFYSGELDSGGVAAKRRVNALRRGPALFRGELGALFERERLYLLRDPVLKMLFIHTLFWSAYMFIVLAVLRMSAGDEVQLGPAVGRWVLLGSAAMLGYMESGLLFNKFGNEGSQLTSVLLTPASRRNILLAKSAFYLLHFAPVNLLLVLAIASTLKVEAPYIFAAAAIVITNTILTDSVGSFVSIFMPFTYRRRGARMRPVLPQQGCGYLMMYLLVFNVANLITLPGSVSVVAGTLLYGWAGLAIGIAVCALEVFVAWRFLLPWAARLLAERENQLLEMLSVSAD